MMLHELFDLTRPLIVFDAETTGADVKNDRIVELGFQLYTSEGLQKEWRSLINPGVPIPAAVTEIHGITDEMVQGCRVCQLSRDACSCEKFLPVPSFSNIASSIAKGFSDCDFAGKNIRFDLRILSSEMARAGVPWSYVGARIIDAERLEQIGEPRTLSALHKKHLGYELEGAHGALSDVQGTTRVICAQLEKYAEVLPRDLDKLHKLQWPGYLCEGGQFRMVNGVAICTFGKNKGKPMKDIPVDYYDWILSSDFPEDVKALAREAKLGRFPG